MTTNHDGTINVVHWGVFGESETSLHPGVINDDARHVFRNGQCHALALAIHEATGWEIGGIEWQGRWDDDDDEMIYDEQQQWPSHVVARMPDGSLLDVEGEPGELGGFSSSDYEPLDPKNLSWLWENGGYLEPDMEAARLFVEPVLARAA